MKDLELAGNLTSTMKTNVFPGVCEAVETQRLLQSHRIRKPLRFSMRFLWMLALLVLWTLLATLPARAEDFTYVTNNGTITITGYTGPGGDVTIPSTIDGLPVTSIGDYAFLSETGPTSITIPNTITTIGDGAFAYTSLTNVKIPDSVITIGKYAFYESPRLTSITIGNGVTTIGDSAFWYCMHLTSVTIPNKVTNIEGWTFHNCYSLTKVTIPDSVTSIGDHAFYGCHGLTRVTVPDHVTTIGQGAFEECYGLTCVCFQGNAPILGSFVFDGTHSPTVYHLPGTTGWGSTFGDRPTALWHLPQPVILDFGPGFGVQTNRFGFIISWATNASVVVEASLNLAALTWSPVATNTITIGTDPVTDGWSYFSDPQWADHPTRFYRLRSP